MNPINLFLLCLILAVLSTLTLRFIGRTVPIVLIGLPVILAGLGAIGTLSLLSYFAVPGAACAIGSLVSSLACGIYGYKMASDSFTDSMMK